MESAGSSQTGGAETPQWAVRASEYPGFLSIRFVYPDTRLLAGLAELDPASGMQKGVDSQVLSVCLRAGQDWEERSGCGWDQCPECRGCDGIMRGVKVCQFFVCFCLLSPFIFTLILPLLS